MKKTRYLFYGLTRNSQNPLDPRLKIQSLSTIDTELKLQYRYNGLIFFVEDVNVLYVFLEDLTTPIKLSSYLSGNLIFGINNTDGDYSTLVEDLNETNPSLGSFVTVYPLGVTFIYDGNAWKYFSGIYKVADDFVLDTIPTSLKKINAQIDIIGTIFLFDATLAKSSPIINVTVKPTTPINDRYYNLNGIFFHSYFGSWIRLGDKVLVSSLVLEIGTNQINHNFDSENVTAVFTFMDLEINSKITVPLEIRILSANSVILLSKMRLLGTLTLTAK